ncbi:MAG TPA: PaaI family thioesterase [Novosphingobium sp.]|nr:PaaI family thioesterase [Novosphingobium sp.]
MSTHQPPPEGFGPTLNFGTFHDLTGPYYEMVLDERRAIVGMYVDDKHLNGHHNIHGGVYLTLADTAMTCAAVRHAIKYGDCVTTTLSSELLAGAKKGEWIEADVEILKAGRRVVFLTCVVRRGRGGTEPLLRASATFIIKQRKA